MQYTLSTSMKILCMIIILAVIICFGGCTSPVSPAASDAPAEEATTPVAETDAVSEQRLYISAETDQDAFTVIPAVELNGNYDSSVRYHGVKDVRITLDGSSYPLEEAIADGLITVEEIMAYAQIDARNGFCTEDAGSYNGLSHFVYHYPNTCDLYFTHDIYETPDGEKNITNYFSVHPYYGADFTYVEGSKYDENGDSYPIDQEDWGLQFKITDSSSTGFSLNVWQSKGQQIGDLHVTDFILFCTDEDAPEEVLDLSTFTYYFDSEDSLISRDSTTTITVNFADAEDFPDTLPSGNYKMRLEIEDIFDEDDVHPLMLDFYSRQYYYVYFQIP